MFGLSLIFQSSPVKKSKQAVATKPEAGSAHVQDQLPSPPVQEKSPVCIFAGEGTLIKQCLQIWKDKGLSIDYVLSPDPAVQSFSREQGVPLLHSWEDLTVALARSPVDYLFSIGNHQIIKAGLLEHVRKGAVNCHYGPLPKYAGIHSPSWAILNNESFHGITWHKVTPQIDTGDILVQKRIEVSPDETAMTLDARCYEAALSGFSELLDSMLKDRLEPVAQDISQRSYFSLKDRPARGGIIDWHQPAGEIDRLFRALYFGPYQNTLGLPKIRCHNHLIIPAGFRILSHSSALPPGTVVDLKEDCIQISTGTFDVELSGATTLQGRKLSPADLQKDYGWRCGMQFPVLVAEAVASIEKMDAALAPFQNYWARKLTALQPTALPYASRFPLQEGKAGKYHYRVGAVSVPASGTFAVWEEKADPVTFLSAALVVYLHRISNVSDVFIGFSTEELFQTQPEPVPFFAPVVPFGVAGINPDDGFGEICQAARRELTAVQKRQTYTLDLVARFPGLRSRPELQADPAFQVNLLITGSLDSVPARLPGMLTLIIAGKESRYVWAGDSERLDQNCMDQIAGQFATLLEHLGFAPATPLKHLNILSETERQKIIFDWNQTEHPYNQSVCMHHLFEQQVQKTPHAIAVRTGDQSLTYRQLDQKANQLAHRLRKAGVGPDVLVGICTEKSFEMVIGVLGIQKAGGAYVPLDPKAPKDRQAVVLDDLQLSALVTQPELTDRFAGYHFEIIALDPDGQCLANEPVTKPESTVTPDHLAYIIYTSGSTGIPKGVMVRHRPAINLIEWVNNTFSVGPADCVLFVNSLGFDLSVYDIFGMLAAGGTIRIANAEELADPQRLLRILQEEPITFWNSAPATLSQLIPFRNADQMNPSVGTHLRLAFLSGDWIPLTMPGWIQDTFPGTQVISLGGATEATVWSNYYPIGQLQEEWVSIPYGKPIQNARYHILDSCLQPVPAGIPGDLYIGGDCLAEGYFKRPELNLEKFIPDPFSSRAGDRLYRTGDLARYFPDGNMEFLGRVDHQVKVRGYRIELGEIEAALSRREDLQEVLVVAGPDPAGGKRLIAYLVPKAGFTPGTPEIRSFLKDKLPDYMIPAAFVWLKTFPLNASGKIDRKALPEPHAVQQVSGHYAPPRNPAEKLLAQVWQEEMGIEKISMDANFFDLGGHSLMAGKIISRIHQVTGRLLPLSSVFANPTIGGLACLLAESSPGQVWNTLVPVRETGSKPPLFCIHPISGDVEYVYKLASYLDEEQPVYGIMARGMNGTDAPCETIEEAAKFYLQAIIEKQPQGPYQIGGYSYGGYVAYDIASRLTKMGQKVENLFLYDTYPRYTPNHNQLVPVRYILISYLCAFLSFKKFRYLIRREYCRSARWVSRKIAGMMQPGRQTGILSGSTADLNSGKKAGCLIADRHRDYLMRILDQSLLKYKVPEYPGKVVFFRAVEGPARYLLNSDFGWRRKAVGRVAVHNIHGAAHPTLFKEEEHVRQIAEQMNMHLRMNPEGSKAEPVVKFSPTDSAVPV